MSEKPPTASAALAKLGAEAGLCATCSHAKLNETRRGTVYLRCLKAEWDERMIRYPRLPVRACPGFEVADHAAGLSQAGFRYLPTGSSDV